MIELFGIEVHHQYIGHVELGKFDPTFRESDHSSFQILHTEQLQGMLPFQVQDLID